MADGAAISVAAAAAAAAADLFRAMLTVHATRLLVQTTKHLTLVRWSPCPFVYLIQWPTIYISHTKLIRVFEHRSTSWMLIGKSQTDHPRKRAIVKCSNKQRGEKFLRH